MSAARIIAALDRMLAKEGEVILLRRRVGTSQTYFVEVVCRGKVSGFDSSLLISGIAQTASTILLSPTAIQAAIDGGTWPGAAGGPVWPRVGDFLRQSGGTDRKVEATLPQRIGDVVVRVPCKVLG